MVEKNGDQCLGGGFLNEVAQALVESSERLLLPWLEDREHLRGFVLGSLGSNGGMPAGRLVFDRTPREVRIQAQILEYGYQATWTGKDFDSLLEVIENDFQTGSVPWQPTYKEQQREKRSRGVAR